MELMVVIVIAGILGALAAPAMRDIMMNNRITTETNDLLAALLFSRSEAIKRSQNVYMCKSTDPFADPPACDTVNLNPWTTGWIIYVNVDGIVNQYSAPGNDILLLRGDGFSGANNKITTDASLQNNIVYTALGFIENNSGTFNICDSRGADHARRIDVAATGRPRIRSDNVNCS